MSRRLLIRVTPVALVLAIIAVVAAVAWANNNTQTLPFTQDWTNTNLITANNNWNNVPGIVGYSPDTTGSNRGVDPQTITDDRTTTASGNVIANQTNPNTLNPGGVAEFHSTQQTPPANTNSTIALSGADNADSPNIVINLNTTGQQNVNVRYNLRDIDGSNRNAAQRVALQYRVGNSGAYTNVPAGYVADATTGPNLATQVTPVNATLPSDANNKPQVQVRVITANANSSTNANTNDEWVGVDDINITGVAINTPPQVTLPGPTLAYTENDPPTVIDSSATVTDTDSANFDNGTLTVDFSTGGTADDRLAIRDQGTGAGQIGVSGSNVTYGGTTIGTFAGGTGTVPLVVTFNSNATPAAVQALARNITYANVSDNPSTASRTVRFVVTDGDGGTSNAATKTINVTAVNDAPDAVNDAAITNEDTPVTVNVLPNDRDPEGDALTVASNTQPQNGTVSCTSAGSCTYTPNSNFNGTDSFTYTISDGRGGTDTAVVTITVRPVNDAPDAVNDTATTDEDTPVTVNVLSNDPDPDGDSLTIAANTQGTNGTVSCTTTTCTYTPRADFNGTDSFTYTVSDGNGGTDTATVTITVEPVNDEPVAVDDATTAEEDGDPVSIDVLANDEDVDGDALTIADNTQPPAGQGTVDCTETECTYTPDADFNGTTSFEYTASDGNGGIDTATVTITVTPVNDAPVAVDDAYTTDEDEELTVEAPGVLTNDADVEDDSLTAELVTGPSNGTLTLNPDGSFTYAPEGDFEGTDTFTYRASDGTDESNTATVTITVNPVNDAPVAVPDIYTTDEDEELTVEAPGVLGNDNDTDGDALTAELVDDVDNGTLDLNSDGSFTYTPEADFEGTDSFTYKANDGAEDSNVTTVTITVTGVNDDPVANDDAETTNEEEPVEVDVLANDADVDGDILEVESFTQPENGEVTRGSDDRLTYTPDEDFSGADTFEYTVSDGNSGEDTATVTITVTPVNDAPVAATDLAATTDEDTPTTITLSGTDADGDELAFEIVEAPDHGTLGSIGTVSCTGTASTTCSAQVTYTPNANYNGPDSFTYQVNDGTTNSNTATVTITVTPVNDAPVANDDEETTDEDTPVTLDVLADDTDPDGDTLLVESFTQGAHGTVDCSPDGVCQYTPDRNFYGEDTFTYTATDGLSSDTATVTITVEPVNDAPLAVANDYSTEEDTELNVPEPGVLLNDTDAEDDTLTAELVENVKNGTLDLNPDGSFTYMPNSNFNGEDTFTYRADDGTNESNVATVTITVEPENDAPVVAVNNAYSTNEDTQLSRPAPGVLRNDFDADGDQLTASLVTEPENGTLDLNPDGSFTYTPNANFNGTDTFVYRASDGNANSDDARVTILVQPVNDSPDAVEDDATTPEDTPVNIDVLQNDTDPDQDPENNTNPQALSVLRFTQPEHGVVNCTSTGVCTYTPDANFNGEDTFTYTVTDGTSVSTTTVTVTVTATNDVPVAVDDSYRVDEDGTLDVEAPGVLENDADVDENDGRSAILVRGPQNGTLDLDANGSFTYKPDANFNGTDTFTYKANDGDDDSNTATVTIVVTPQDEPDPRGCTITGTRGNDNMRGTSGPDVICGDGGNDTINGLGGDDVIYGGPGRDRISGGSGKDRLFGEAGIDFLDTTDRVRNNDTANGGPDKDDCAGDQRDKRVSCP